MATPPLTISAVVFDLDGTLIDASTTIALACNRALNAHGFRQRSGAEIASFVGDGATSLMAKAAALSERDPRVALLTGSFVDDYRRAPCEGTQLLPEARETLIACSRLPLALCTNKPRMVTESVVRGMGLDRFFVAINAGGDQPERKPRPEPLLSLATELQLDPKALLMVGDGAQDIECGRRAGAVTVGVPSKFGSREQLISSNPDKLLQRLSELPALIEAWSPATWSPARPRPAASCGDLSN